MVPRRDAGFPLPDAIVSQRLLRAFSPGNGYRIDLLGVRISREATGGFSADRRSRERAVRRARSEIDVLAPSDPEVP
jgi:hypothetical protein